MKELQTWIALVLSALVCQVMREVGVMPNTFYVLGTLLAWGSVLVLVLAPLTIAVRFKRDQTAAVQEAIRAREEEVIAEEERHARLEAARAARDTRLTKQAEAEVPPTSKATHVMADSAVDTKYTPA